MALVDSTTSKVSLERSSPLIPPDRHKFENEVSKITRVIKDKEKLIEYVSTDNKDIGEQLSSLGIELENLEDKRSRLITEMKNIDENLRKLGIEVSKHKAEANRLVIGLKFMTEDKHEEQIKKLESQVHTGQFSFNNERKLLLEIESLKKAKLKVKDYHAARNSVSVCRNEQDELRNKKDTLHQQNKAIREKMNSIKDEMAFCRQQLDGRRDEQRERKANQESLTKDIAALYVQRRQLHEQFRHYQLQYMDAIKSSSPDTTSRTGRIRQQQDEHRTSREMKRKAYRSSKQDSQKEHTYEEEKAICRALIIYLSRLTGTSAALIGEGSPSPIPSAGNSPSIPPRRLTDESNSEYVVLPRKGEVDEEWMPSGTRRDRKDKRKSKKERKKSFVGIKSHQKPIHHNATTFEQFGRLGLQPPVIPSDIPNTLDQLKDKMVLYDSVHHVKADSEAGDSGIMSSTGISEFSEYGNGDHELASGEVTPNTHNRMEMSPSPIQINNDTLSFEQSKQLSNIIPIHNTSTTDDSTIQCTDDTSSESTAVELTEDVSTGRESC